MTDADRRLVILAEGMLDFHHGKTAVSLLRYRPQDVVAVIDSTNAGRTTDDVVGLAGSTPIVPTVEDAMQFTPRGLLIGIAPRGGELPAEWRRQILVAIEHGLTVINGLHYMLNEDEEFAAVARQSGAELVDVRRPPDGLGVALLQERRPGSHVVTFVGSDCAVGKMTAALEVADAARREGLPAEFVATGQTGIILDGQGIAIDRVIGDFMAGAVEELVVEASDRADWVLVEGQGSLLHPGYSGVTLALLHGSAPDGMILVHQPSRHEIDEYPISLPPLERLVAIYQEAASWIKPAPVLAVALNTRDLDELQTATAIDDAEQRTGLPATDPVKFGGEKIVRALVESLGRPAQPKAGSAASR